LALEMTMAHVGLFPCAVRVGVATATRLGQLQLHARDGLQRTPLMGMFVRCFGNWRGFPRVFVPKRLLRVRLLAFRRSDRHILALVGVVTARPVEMALSMLGHVRCSLKMHVP